MKDEDDRLVYLAAGPIAAMALGVALIPLRETTSASNLTFLFLVVTIVIGDLGGRPAAVATALTSALSLDFFLTRPYLQLSIDSKHDLIAFLGLALCGLVAAALGSRRPTTASRAQNGALEEALRQLESGGPPKERLRAILGRLLAAFPIAAASVRDRDGLTLAACGPAAFSEQVPAVETRAEELADRRGRSPLGRQIPAAGIRIALSASGRTAGSLDLWGERGAVSGEGRRLLSAVARAIGALLGQAAHTEAPATAEPARVESAWMRPGHRPAEE